ncbi:hypothetical protein FALBO_6516 [Fusarium albosuccineum]|uniref:Uncharacterized protein n=1 Tax=Fusarium albosuccineum TaxID=1237068 RepID=A0A8H4P8S3_9HYPO|nr:hypothetical protein FALBO_6516 [Fusarium albosuccineum]
MRRGLDVVLAEDNGCSGKTREKGGCVLSHRYGAVRGARPALKGIHRHQSPVLWLGILIVASSQDPEFQSPGHTARETAMRHRILDVAEVDEEGKPPRHQSQIDSLPDLPGARRLGLGPRSLQPILELHLVGSRIPKAYSSATREFRAGKIQSTLVLATCPRSPQSNRLDVVLSIGAQWHAGRHKLRSGPARTWRLGRVVEMGEFNSMGSELQVLHHRHRPSTAGNPPVSPAAGQLKRRPIGDSSRRDIWNHFLLFLAARSLRPLLWYGYPGYISIHTVLRLDSPCSLDGNLSGQAGRPPRERENARTDDGTGHTGYWTHKAPKGQSLQSPQGPVRPPT